MIPHKQWTRSYLGILGPCGCGSVFQVACVLYIINILYDGLSSALAPCLDHCGAVLHIWNGCP